jgi:hypothetical protein
MCHFPPESLQNEEIQLKISSQEAILLRMRRLPYDSVSS